MCAKSVCQIVTIVLSLVMGAVQAGAQQDEDAAESRIFVKLAQEATLADGILTLHDVGGNMLWFSDRPFPYSGSMDIARLIEACHDGDDSFADNPPNAVLSGMSVDGKVAILVVLIAPRYEDNALSFRFAAITEVLPNRLSNVVLMIDDIRTICPQFAPDDS